MRRHELPKGVICQVCGKVVYKPDYVRLAVERAITEDSTGRMRRIASCTLCIRCYTSTDRLLIENGRNII